MNAGRTDTETGILLLRLEAPLMSFGDIAVDERRPTAELPGRALLTGLLANALGWRHGDAGRLARLQERLVYAVRRDRPGASLEDFHTVDLGQVFLLQGWTTRGRIEARGKGAATRGTHIRRRHYLAGAAYTVALALAEPREEPTLDALERALRQPARPLFLGRKTCLPARPLVGRRGEADRLTAPSPLHALARTPVWARAEPRTRDEDSAPPSFRVWWPGAPGGAPPERDGDAVEGLEGLRFDRSFPVVDDRDWRHQFHAGQRFVNEGLLWLGAGQTGGAPDE